MQIVMIVVRKLMRALVFIATDLIIVAVRKHFVNGFMRRRRFSGAMAF